MSLLLYHFPHSTCSQKVRLALWEKEIEFDTQAIDHKSREQTSQWYLKLNPNGVVPTLMHDDAVIIDSSVIIEYLDDVFPENSLTPSDPVKRAHMRKWMRYFEEVPTPAIRVPSFNQYLAGRLNKFTDEEFKEITDNHPIRKQFYQKMEKGKGFDEQESEASLDRLRQSVDRVEKGLKESGGPWIMGEQLTLADYTLVPAVDRMEDLGLSYIWDHAPLFQKWFADIKQRPAFDKTYHEKTRLSEIFS
jgi:glutathione S-transferase